MIKIAVAGERGAFAEIAAQKYFSSSAAYKNVAAFDEVFRAVKNKECDYGVIPIENTLAGSIHGNYDLLLASKLYISAEIYLRVNHFLVGKTNTAPRNVRRIFSHPMALAQCAKFLKRLPRVEQVPVANTALAAKMVAQDGRADTAAIASAQAAAEYSLKILKPDIEDRHDNVTRFLVISRNMAGGKIRANNNTTNSAINNAVKNSAINNNNDNALRKTSIVFSIKNIPGGLFKALGVFALRDIDLFKIESRPVRGKGFNYLFYLDCRGDVSDVKLKNAVSHLREITTFYRLLGSYDVGADG